TSVAFSGGLSKRNRNDTDWISTGPPKYTLWSRCAQDSSSGKTRATGIRVGLLMMTPAGDGPMWFITSTIESLKLGSGSSARATRRIVVNGFALSAVVDHEMAHRTHNAQRALIIGRIVRRCLKPADPIFARRARLLRTTKVQGH